MTHAPVAAPSTPQPARPGATRATIKDVAARAGVGIGTVSRVMNDHPAVTDETRARVREAVEALDYHPSRAARALSSQRSHALAIVVPFFTHPSAVERLRGVLAAVHDSHFDVVLFNLDHADRRPGRLGRVLRGDLADGVLLVSLRPTAEEATVLGQRALPVVVVDAEVEGVPSIVVDDVAGGRLAARHLLDLGHRRIAYVGDEVDPRFGFTSSEQRRHGLSLALADAGCPLEDSLVRLGPHGRESAKQLAGELFALADPPTAVFAHSDVQAIGVLEAAEDAGRRVPEDVSVVGFDDLDLARLTGLTTIRQPLFESGRLGGVRLLELLAQRRGVPAAATPSGRVELPLELVVRRTTGPAPARRPSRSRGARRAAS